MSATLFAVIDASTPGVTTLTARTAARRSAVTDALADALADSFAALAAEGNQLPRYELAQANLKAVEDHLREAVAGCKKGVRPD
jgi:hypothetical protein